MDEIYEALVAKVKALGVTLDLPVAYPEGEFDPPPVGEPYLNMLYLPNRPAFGGLSAGRIDQGLLQVDIVYPKRLGIKKPYALARQIIALFPNGSPLGAGIKVVGQTWAAAPLSDDKEVRVPVTISWHAG